MPRPVLGFAVPTKSTWPVTVIPARTNPSGWNGVHFSAPVNASSAATVPGYFPSAVLPPPTNSVPLAYGALTMVLSPKSGEAPPPLIWYFQRIPPARLSRSRA